MHERVSGAGETECSICVGLHDSCGSKLTARIFGELTLAGISAGRGRQSEEPGGAEGPYAPFVVKA